MADSLAHVGVEAQIAAVVLMFAAFVVSATAAVGSAKAGPATFELVAVKVVAESVVGEFAAGAGFVIEFVLAAAVDAQPCCSGEVVAARSVVEALERWALCLADLLW